MGLQLQPQLGPLTSGHPGLPLTGTFDPSLGLGTPSLLPHLEALHGEPGECLSSEGLIVRET